MGHFTFWFAIGTAIFFLLRRRFPACTPLVLYGPFIPFALGSLAALPYLLQVTGLLSPAALASRPFVFWLGYALLERSPLMCRLLGSFHADVSLAAALYAALLFHYVSLIRSNTPGNAQ